MGRDLGGDLFYNRKTDNFLELDTIEDIVIAALQDEEIIGKPAVVGTF